MAILAADHFAERIGGAVVSSGLPFRTQVFQAKVSYLFATGVGVVLFLSQGDTRDTDVMATVAQSGAAQKIDPLLIAAGNVECALGGDGKLEWADLIDTRCQKEAHVGKPVSLEAAIQVRSGHVMAEVAGNTRSPQGRMGARGRTAADVGGQQLSAALVNHVVIAQRAQLVGTKLIQHTGEFRHFALGWIFAIHFDVGIVAGEAEAGLHLPQVRKVLCAEHVRS